MLGERNFLKYRFLQFFLNAWKWSKIDGKYIKTIYIYKKKVLFIFLGISNKQNVVFIDFSHR